MCEPDCKLILPRLERGFIAKEWVRQLLTLAKVRVACNL